MSSAENSKNSSGSKFVFKNNIISNSAIGDHSVAKNQSFDAEKLVQFSLKLKDLQNEVRRLSNKLSQEDITKVANEIVVVENQIQKPEKITPQVILNSLKEISGILGEATAAGIVLNQLFDIAKTLFIR